MGNTNSNENANSGENIKKTNIPTNNQLKSNQTLKNKDRACLSPEQYSEFIRESKHNKNDVNSNFNFEDLNNMREKKEIKTNMNNDLYNRYIYSGNQNEFDRDRLNFYSTCNNGDSEINSLDNTQKNAFDNKESHQNIYVDRNIPQTSTNDKCNIDNEKIFNYNNQNNDMKPNYPERKMPIFNKKPNFNNEQFNQFNNSRKTEDNKYSKCVVNEKTYAKNSKEVQANNILNNQNDPYLILNINQDITLKELNNVYKKIVLKYHPDRPNGNNKLFDKYTGAYKEIQAIIKANMYKDHNELKNENDEVNLNKNVSLYEKDKFNPKKFNKFYEENRVIDANDSGYGTWRVDEKPDPVKMTNFTQDNFNSKFNKTVKAKPDNQIQRLYNLDNNISSAIQFTELGKDVVDDFSGKINNIEYTDYKKAHTTERLIDPNNVVVNSYKNLDELEKARSNISYEMDEQEKEYFSNKEKVNQILENRRLSNLKNKDKNIGERFKEINQKMLK